MSQSTITKSIRLSSQESTELARLSIQCTLSESALMKKWILSGIQAQKLDLAVQAYMARQVDIREGAAQAGVSYNRFMRELEMRNIVTLEADGFLQRLEFLANTFQDEGLNNIVQEVQQQTVERELV